jgi:transposase InsO family protein
METIYYDPKHPSSLGGVHSLQQATKEKAAAWLQTQRAYTLHKPARKTFQTRKTRTSHSHSQWQADLNDMIAYSKVNKGYRYILTVIDVFSRYAWAEPLKSKTAKQIIFAFKKIFKVTPSYLQTDRGKEFENGSFQKFLHQHGVKWFAVTSTTKASLCERFNRTLKTRMFRYFTYRGSYKWVDVLQQLISSYNQSVHRSLPKGMTPHMAVQSLHHKSVWQNQEKDDAVKKSSKQLKLGDEVRISKHKDIFRKGYLSNWSEEIFIIAEIDDRFSPAMYVIKDEQGHKIVGKFYGSELQKVSNASGLYAIEKIIKRKANKTLVKFIGYPGTYWVNKVYKQ